MDWKKVVGRVLSLGAAAVLLLFAITGVVPSWWPGVIATVTAVANVIIGEWNPPA
ncbi:MAG: hypothetical protein LAO04_21605 [Acidobacteriia bacterium]|nr:hypothetical protein [Terriglobia bacterium]